jgi:EmrB/QacA subfamily drug resistance transporter
MQTTAYPLRWWALLVLSLSLIVISLDNTILNVAIPSMKQDLGATATQMQWIVDAYMLVFAGLLLTIGSLGDRFGRKKVLTLGLALFGTASAAAAFMDDPGAIIACRAVMGIGGAAIMPATLSIITAIFPADERPKAIAAWAAVSGLGIVIGPVTGGLLVEHADWSWVFLVNAPLVLTAIVAGHWLVPESKDPHATRLDVRGAVLSMAGLAALVYAIIEGGGERGWTDGTVVACFAAGAALIAAFVAWELRAEHPMLDMGFFRNRRFSAASAAIAMAFFALFGMMFFLTQYFQDVLDKTPVQAGLWALPAAAGMMMLAGPSAKVAERVGTKAVVTAGLLTTAAGMAWFSTAGVDSAGAFLVASQWVIGAGIGLAMAPATDAVMGSLPLAKAGVGSAVNDTNRIVGGALGVAVLGSLLNSGYRGDMDQATHGLPAGAAHAARDSVGTAGVVADGIGGSAGRALDAAANAAFVDAMSTAALAGAGLALVGALVALAWLPSREAPAQEPAAVTPIGPAAEPEALAA